MWLQGSLASVVSSCMSESWAQLLKSSLSQNAVHTKKGIKASWWNFEQRTWIKVCWQLLHRELSACKLAVLNLSGKDPKVTLNRSLWNAYPENCLGDKISQGHLVRFSSLCHLWFKLEGIYDGLTFWSPGICVWHLTEGEKRKKKKNGFIYFHSHELFTGVLSLAGWWSRSDLLPGSPSVFCWFGTPSFLHFFPNWSLFFSAQQQWSHIGSLLIHPINRFLGLFK